MPKLEKNKVNTVEEKMKSLELINQILSQALKFYASIPNWSIGDSYKQHSVITDSDLEYFFKAKSADLIGGLIARKALKQVEEIRALACQSKSN